MAVEYTFLIGIGENMKDIIRMTEKHLIVKVGNEKAYIDNVDDAGALVDLIEYESSLLGNLKNNTRIYRCGRHYEVRAMNERIITIAHVVGWFYTLAIQDRSSFNVELRTVTGEDLNDMRNAILSWIG